MERKVDLMEHSGGGMSTSSGQGISNAGFKNLIINGGFDIWQRGSSFVSSTYEYTADRWIVNASGISIERVVKADGRIAARVSKNTATGAYQRFEQRIELPKHVANKTITISGKIEFKSSSPSSYWYTRWTVDGTATTSSWASVGVDNTNINTEQDFHITIVVPSDATDYSYFSLYLLGNAADGGVDYDIEYSQIQIEIGDVATPFEHRPIGLELSLCQRYYLEIEALEGASNSYGEGVDSGVFSIYFPVIMRTTPTTGISVAPTLENCSDFHINADTISLRGRVNVTTLGRYRAYSGKYTANAEL